ncbi:acetate/propionate family kinase [Planctomycetota bacterium]
MKILVLNCGSSSVKFLLYEMEEEVKLAKGLVERIGSEGAAFRFTNFDKKFEGPLGGDNDHDAAIVKVIDFLIEEKIIKNADEIEGVGHRVVHGGEAYKDSVIIDEAVVKTVRDLIPLAPLHNPANLDGIEGAVKLLPNAKQVAVFDTAFHQTMPADAYLYAIPYEYYEEQKVRRYGFHGTSHSFISQRMAEIGGKGIEGTRIISVHLGNGCSICAVQSGKSVDTSMGLTPLEGLVMGTRSGDLDPGLVTSLVKQGIMSSDPKADNYSDKILNKKSGLLGLYGKSNDMREIQEAMEAGEERARLAFAVTARRLKKYIAAYAAVMGGVDYLVFTAGIGENSVIMRAAATEGLGFMGLELDPEKNRAVSGETCISTDGSPSQIWVIPTKEELYIARDTKKVLLGLGD